ncbi:hypothetical protein AK812_SmicGene16988 [Symbiodinium microadriaticum]|uniref:Uncharacterized protein n=1 Tax=Symbiodinium microadriaticum TaxID=2951 RepID=A0A1Q9DYV6_SYMMI|nr:hypothetical protein AK812_SmicGene16988 [Symbiodinium microadriaticum]
MSALGINFDRKMSWGLQLREDGPNWSDVKPETLINKNIHVRRTHREKIRAANVHVSSRLDPNWCFISIETTDHWVLTPRGREATQKLQDCFLVLGVGDPRKSVQRTKHNPAEPLNARKHSDASSQGLLLDDAVEFVSGDGNTHTTPHLGITMTNTVKILSLGSAPPSFVTRNLLKEKDVGIKDSHVE